MSGGVLYGNTDYGGPNGGGTVFKMNTDGSGYMMLKDQIGGGGRLLLDGNTLYGGTRQTVFKINTDGSGYTVIKVLNPFAGEGAGLYAGVVLNGSTLYGTTRYSGPGTGYGTVFKVKTDGSGFRTLKSFGVPPSDGLNPGYASLVLGGRTLYGTTQRGGSGPSPFGDGIGPGTIFALDLRPPLNLQMVGNQLVLSWTDAAFALQSAPVINGTFTNIPGATSPYTNSTTGGQQFFRLIGY